MVEAADTALVRLLFVCTGNLCRSAAADRIVSAWAARSGRSVAVRSAGTRAPVGRPIHPSTERALRRHQVPAGDFTSRLLSEADVEWADLVLTMTGQHREEVLAVSPRGMHKCFTLLEAAALCAAVPPARPSPPGMRRGAAVAAALREARMQFARAHGPDFDIIDPIDRPDGVHVEVVDQITAALEVITPVLDGAPDGAHTAPMPRLPPVPPPFRMRP